MEKKKRFNGLPLIVSLILTAMFAVIACAADTPRMTREELKAQLGNPDLIVLDVRRGGDWIDSDYKIKGAVREEPGQEQSWAGHYPKDKTLVLYCS